MSVRIVLLAVVIAFGGLLDGLSPHSALAATPQSAIPFKSEPSPLETHGERVLYALGGLIVLALGGLWLQRKLRPGTPLFPPSQRPLQVIGRTRLTARSMLVVVRYRDEEMLLAVSGDRVVRLDTAASVVVPPSGAAREDGDHA
ncbi:MAG: flagellar biosynthetic protein FliO [Methyloversatilis sp.]|nr:flagellar biosynthetic protein FliO [Methyloversatilis sp.]